MDPRIKVKAAVFVMIVIFCVSAQTVYAEKLVTTISVGNSPDAIAYDPGKGEVFVANTNANTVSVISDVTNTVVASPTSGYTSTSAPEFPIDAIILLAIAGVGIYLVIRYKTRLGKQKVQHDY